MPNLSRRTLLGTGLAVAAAGATGAVLWPRDDLEGAYFAEDGVALRGADPVAYFTEGRAVIGRPEFSYDWSGATWHFASAGHRDAFAAEPQKYAPQYGGYCAWAVAAKQKLFSTQPGNWAIVGGKLYLNYSDDVQTTWNTDRPGFIDRANTAWPKVAPAI